MRDLEYTLLTDGSSDKVLIPILNWLLQQLLPACAIQANFANTTILPRPEKTLSGRIRQALYLYPSPILFIHRDAESFSIEERTQEIERAIIEAAQSIQHVAVIPVRMTEAWLLIDERSLRQAAGNPNAQISLEMPPLHKLEDLADPKAKLHELLRLASGCTGRRLKKFNADLPECTHRLANLIGNYETLRRLGAFKKLEQETREKLRKRCYL